MHFQIIKDDFYPHLVSYLRTMVPEFHARFADDDGAYMILAEFGGFMIDHIEDKAMLKKCCAFLNCAFEKGGNETEDAIVVQVFEQLYGREELENILKPYLNGDALITIEKFKLL